MMEKLPMVLVMGVKHVQWVLAAKSNNKGIFVPFLMNENIDGVEVGVGVV